MAIPTDGSVEPARLKRFEETPHRFYKLIGARITFISKDRLTAEMPVREEIANRGNNMHGGAFIAFVDHLGGAATMVNLGDGYRTTTIESKANFFAPIMIGDVAHAECTPLHKGRTTMVWQTKVTRGDGKLAAVITQTQLVIAPQAKIGSDV